VVKRVDEVMIKLLPSTATAAVAAALLSIPHSCAYKIEHSGSSFVFNTSTNASSNPFIDQSQSFYIVNSNAAGGGLTSSVDPSTIKTYGAGLVGLYPFDQTYVENVTASVASYRASSPCAAALGCKNAIIVGTGNQSVPILTLAGRFGSALDVGLGKSNYAQIRPGPFLKLQPQLGMSQSIWFKSKAKNIKGAAIWPSSSLSELQFNNFDLWLGEWNNCLTCQIRGNGGTSFSTKKCLGSTPNVTLDAWFHVVCTYNLQSTLSLYLNGALVSSTTQVLPDGFQHGDRQPFGLGNRPGTNDNYIFYASDNSFNGYLDDFALWDRSLSSEEVAAMYSSNVALVAAPRIVLTTQNVVRVNNTPTSDPFANEFNAVNVSWTGTNAKNVTVEISTDSGKSWCKVENAVAFTDGLHGGESLICLFPSVTLKIRATFTGGETIILKSLKADFLRMSPYEPAWKRVPIGMNVGGVTYWITSWPFIDVFKAGGGTSWPVVRSGTDKNGWPLEINPALDAPNGVYWVTGQNILMNKMNGNYPGGMYTLIAEGSGLITLSWDSGYRSVPTPCRYEFNVTPTDQGMQLFIKQSTLGNYVKNIQVYMPGFAPRLSTTFCNITNVNHKCPLETGKIQLCHKFDNGRYRTICMTQQESASYLQNYTSDYCGACLQIDNPVTNCTDTCAPSKSWVCHRVSNGTISYDISTCVNSNSTPVYLKNKDDYCGKCVNRTVSCGVIGQRCISDSECCGTCDKTQGKCAQLFHPLFLDSLDAFKRGVIRFMDWGATNSQQVSKWSERNTFDSVSQARSYRRAIAISSIVQTGATLFSGNQVVLITTTEAHGLATGQRITITGSNGNVILTSGLNVSFDVSEQMVEVITNTTFVVGYERWYWDSSYVTQSVTSGNKGSIEIRLSPGVSLEVQIALSNKLGSDGWFCVPHLADDDYIQNMAILIRDTLNPGLKAYIEYSNEVWNWAPGFQQTRYALKKATALGQTAGDRHLWYSGQRAGAIFRIFDAVFGSAARTRIVRVIGAQGGGGDVQLSQVGVGGADALAIAPYFGGGLNSEIYNSKDWANLTTDQILDMARSALVSDVLGGVKSSVVIAKKFGVKVIAYEGGQHMGGGGSCGSGDCCFIPSLQQKFQSANRHPRIKGLYQNMLKAWSLAVGDIGGVFTAFSHIGADSKYGSWGALQYQNDDRSKMWKYNALVENIGN